MTTLSPATRALLEQALDLPASKRGELFDELFDSLAGHDELELLMGELERRGDLAWEPDMDAIERRVREAEADPSLMRPAEEVFASLSKLLAETRATRPETAKPRLSGPVGDLAGAAQRLSPVERSALALAILETIERSEVPEAPTGEA